MYLLNSPPPLHVTIGDTIVINAHNQLDVPTALHSHGMFQNGSVWMDGVRILIK